MHVPFADMLWEAELVDTASTRTLVSRDAVRDLLIVLAGEISPIAVAGRRYTVTDKQVDVFAAEICAALGEESLTLQKLTYFVEGSTQVRDRAYTLYQWACEALCRTPKQFKPPVVCGSDPRYLMQLADKLREMRALDLATNETSSQASACIEKLSAYASLVISSTCADHDGFDPFAALHRYILDLADSPSVVDMTALANQISKEMSSLVNSIISEDTRPNLPTDRPEVRTSRIVVIGSPSSRRDRVSRDRV